MRILIILMTLMLFSHQAMAEELLMAPECSRSGFSTKKACLASVEQKFLDSLDPETFKTDDIEDGDALLLVSNTRALERVSCEKSCPF